MVLTPSHTAQNPELTRLALVHCIDQLNAELHQPEAYAITLRAQAWALRESVPELFIKGAFPIVCDQRQLGANDINALLTRSMKTLCDFLTNTGLLRIALQCARQQVNSVENPLNQLQVVNRLCSNVASYFRNNGPATANAGELVGHVALMIEFQKAVKGIELFQRFGPQG